MSLSTGQTDGCHVEKRVQTFRLPSRSNRIGQAKRNIEQNDIYDADLSEKGQAKLRFLRLLPGRLTQLHKLQQSPRYVFTLAFSNVIIRYIFTIRIKKK